MILSLNMWQDDNAMIGKFFFGEDGSHGACLWDQRKNLENFVIRHMKKSAQRRRKGVPHLLIYVLKNKK